MHHRNNWYEILVLEKVFFSKLSKLSQIMVSRHYHLICQHENNND
jgi:hypothetical protein